MNSKSMILARPVALAIGAALVLGAVGAPADAAKRRPAKRATVAHNQGVPAGVQRPAGEINLSTGRGQLVTLPAPITDVFVSNNTVADVQVQSPTQIYVFGKADGEASVYATTRSGQVVYSSNIRVSPNVNSLDQMLRVAMPDTDVHATVSGQVAVLTGTVKSPDDILQAGDLTRAFLNPGIDLSDPKALVKVLVINRLRTATPLQVTLQVRIAEVSRSFSKNFGVNWQANNAAPPLGGAPRTRFAIDQGGPSNGASISGGTTFNLLNGRLLGLNILGQLDVGETEGFVTTLASPNLTAMSGEKASFVAGGELPIPFTTFTGGGSNTAIIFKTYGIQVDFLPTVLADGRISLTVKPEVSEPDFARAVLGVPGFTTRRVETTVELGSGQSFVIGGLLKNENNNTYTKLPGAGSIPVLGALFRSNAYRRGETELMIVVTPYLVNPVPANKIVLPTDGFKNPSELGRIFGGELYKGTTGEKRPMPSVAPPKTIAVPGTSTRGAAVGTPAPGFSN